MKNRIFETTNAPVPGERSVAEMSYNATMQLLANVGNDWRRCPVLLDSKQVQIDNIYDNDSALEALMYVYGDAVQERGGWIDVRVWLEDIQDPSTSENEARRFYFNEKVNRLSGWINNKFFMKCYEEGLVLGPEDKFTLGFSGNINRSAALVAYRLSDGALFVVSLWERPEDLDKEVEWEVPFVEVDNRVKALLDKKECMKLVANPDNWQEVVGRWYALQEDKVEELWLSNSKARAAAAIEQFETAVYRCGLKWSDSNILRHVIQTHITELPLTTDVGEKPKHLIRQETASSPRYITVSQASVLALEAGVLAIEDGALAEEPEYRLYSY